MKFSLKFLNLNFRSAYSCKPVSNVYFMMIFRLGIVFIFYSVMRLLFYWYNLDLFPDITSSHLLTLMISGLKFDLSAILYINILFVLMMIVPFKFKYRNSYKTSAKYIFLATNSIALVVNLVDFVYFRYTLRRSDFGVFSEFSNETNLVKIFFVALIQNWYLVILFLIFVAILYVAYGDHKQSSFFKSNWSFYTSSLIAMVLVLVLTVGGLRGALIQSTRPITVSNALEKVNEPIETAIVLNTPFSLIRTIKRTRLPKVEYFSEREVDKIYSPIHQGNEKGSFKAENVVIIILESFTKEVSGALNRDLENGNYKGYTPFLDSLIKKSFTWEYSYANGRKSIDAIPSIIAGIPSLVQPFVLSRYSLNDIESLAGLLKKKGYSTSFFHGAPNVSMGFKAFTHLLSVDNYFGLDEYGDNSDSDGFWGVHDEPYLAYCADEFGKLPKPFFTSVFTLTSHHPYTVPGNYGDRFKGGINPVYRVVQYTDMALQKFFAKASTTEWFTNTLFVITADHSLAPMDHEKYKSSIGSFSVPVIFYKPGSSLVGHDSSLVQQIDIFPSVLGYLKYDEPYFAFGRDRFNPTENPFVVNYFNGVYQFMEDGYVLKFDGEKPVGLFDYRNDITLKNNLLGTNPLLEGALLERVKAFIQQYNNRMVDNRLSAD